MKKSIRRGEIPGPAASPAASRPAPAGAAPMQTRCAPRSPDAHEPERKAAEFARDAEAAAREALPGGESVRLSRSGFVVLSVRAVLPVNVAAALEWGDDPTPLDGFAGDAIACSLECELQDGDALPPPVVARFRLPRGAGNTFSQAAAVPFCEAEFSAPSDGEIEGATRFLARLFAPPSPEVSAEVARIMAQIMEDERKRKARKAV